MSNFTFNSLKIISLNVRGLRNNIKRKAVFLYTRKTNANIIFLQETHSCENDNKFWKAQWGDQAHFCHASNHSAGVAILFNKFSGDILETIKSDLGRWIISVIKIDNSLFILCNVYGHNVTAQTKTMFSQIHSRITSLQTTHHNAFLIINVRFLHYITQTTNT